MKIKAAADIGISAKHLKLERDATQSEILQAIDKLNGDPNVHGIIVQMPLDCDDPTIDDHLVTNRVDPGKDFFTSRCITLKMITISFPPKI